MALQDTRGDIYAQIHVPFMTAATGNAAGGGWKAPCKLQIQSATLTWAAAITGTATNFFTVSFFNRTTGAGTVAWATAIAYSSGTNATKATPITLTLSSTAADLVVASGDLLAVELSSTLTGLQVPGGVCTVVVRAYGS